MSSRPRPISEPSSRWRRRHRFASPGGKNGAAQRQAQALRNLVKLAQANMADLHEYAALGVAFSLVFDEPFPADWPHSQVGQDAVPVGDLNIVKRFQFYVQANRDKKLELDLTQLRVEDLKYLVDSEVKLSELEYAQGQSHIPYDHFDQAFFSINYDTSRISSGNEVFPVEPPDLHPEGHRGPWRHLRGPGLLCLSSRKGARDSHHLLHRAGDQRRPRLVRLPDAVGQVGPQLRTVCQPELSARVRPRSADVAGGQRHHAATPGEERRFGSALSAGAKPRWRGREFMSTRPPIPKFWRMRAA